MADKMANHGKYGCNPVLLVMDISFSAPAIDF